MGYRFVVPPHARQRAAVMLVSGDVVRVKLNSLFEAVFSRWPVPLIVKSYHGQGSLCFGQVRIEFYCLFCGLIFATDCRELFFKREMAVAPACLITERKGSISQCITRFDLEGLFATLDAAPEPLTGKFVKVIPALEVNLVGVSVVSAVLGQRLIACANQLHLKGVHNCACNLILNRKDLLHIAIERFGPQMISISRINQLGRYAQAAANLAHTAFQNRLHIQLVADLADVLTPSLE